MHLDPDPIRPDPFEWVLALLILIVVIYVCGIFW